MSSTFLSSSEWDPCLNPVLEHCGDEAFFRYLADACQQLSGLDSTLVVGFKNNYRPMHVFNNVPVRHYTDTLEAYFNGAYLLDPFYALVTSDAADGVYRLSGIAPDGFRKSEYYLTYYERTELRDEVGILLHIPGGYSFLLSLGHRDKNRPTGSVTLAGCEKVLPVLSVLCEKHIAKDSTLSTMFEQTHTTLGGPLDRAFKNFGRDHLSVRECDIVQLILKGYSSKAIARLLGISSETVKVHRKRIHTKLKISSQAELFSLFLEAISMVPLVAPFYCDTDPLSLYLR